MTIAPLPDRLSDDARWLAQAIDPSAGMIRFVEMDRAAYRASSFLDDRIFQAPVTTAICKLEDAVLATPAELRSDARWIFHIGHVGSTLVARLLGEIDGVLSLREPRLLRDLTTLGGPALRELAPALQRLMSRTFAADEVALVKATSFVSEIAPQLVPPGERILFLFDEPRTYIETILAGENSRKELRMLAGVRTERMKQRVSTLAGADRSDAHLAAAAWACEMTSQESAAEAMPDRQILWARFDPMLDRMPQALESLARFFGFAADAPRLREIATGPLMRRYSKALEFDYSLGLRRELLAEARQLHRAEIDQAIDMLEQAAGNSPYLTRALSRAKAEK
jgi:hypothetical protein